MTSILVLCTQDLYFIPAAPLYDAGMQGGLARLWRVNVRVPVPSSGIHPLPPDDTQQHRDDSDDQKDMDQAAGMIAEEADQPGDHQDHSDQI